MSKVPPKIQPPRTNRAQRSEPSAKAGGSAATRRAEKVQATAPIQAQDEIDSLDTRERPLSDAAQAGLGRQVGEGIEILGKKYYGEGVSPGDFLKALGEISGRKKPSESAAEKLLGRETLDLYASRLSRQLPIPTEQARELMAALASALAPE